ncbi:MAG: class I SAM-dependent methyltransferase [bacterium]|nr:class I SAM-dependent methyltransferase [bacterium]
MLADFIGKRIRELIYDPELKYEFPKFVFDKIIQNVSGNILDIGTGDGIKLRNILNSVQNVKQVFATEINPKMYEIAKSNLNQFNVLKGDIRDINFPIKFDTILIFEVIEHVHNPESFLKRAVELLAPDGTMIISTPNSFIYDIFDQTYIWLYKTFVNRKFKYEQDENSLGQAHVCEMNFIQLNYLLRKFFRSFEVIGIYPLHGVFRKIFRSDLLEYINKKINFIPISSRLLAICRQPKI